MSAVQEPLLSVAHLTTSFLAAGRWLPAVRDVSFDIAAGETVAVVGESGSGKSVTALSIMRLIPGATGRIEGSIRFDGQDLMTLAPNRMRAVRGSRIAMIFQEPMTSLNPLFTVGFQIAEALKCHRAMGQGAADAETLRLLERVRIPAAKARATEYPHRLSGGMRQRVMIAMALACKPRLLIADEPTTALDVTIQAQILDLLKHIQAEDGMAVLFITHDMGVVAEIADRTVVMLDGRTVEADRTESVFRAPKHAYTRALLAAVPRLGVMTGQERPLRFPVVDPATGEAGLPKASTGASTALAVVEVRNVTTRFDIRRGVFGKVTGRVYAVENVSLSVHAGETLALVGESGCGKSTIGRSIMRLVEPTSGSILVGGEAILELKGRRLREARRRVQMIFQDPYASLDPRMSVGAAIAEPLRTQGAATKEEARAKVADLLRRVGLAPAMAARFPHEFSGGQRQRIAIARALALGPLAIVADEPVSALDVSIKAQVVNLLLDLQESLGIAYLFISHDMAVVERIAHRVAVMYLGEIVEIGPRRAVFEDPRHPYTRKLLSAVPKTDPAQRGVRRRLSNDEIKNPIRLPDFVPPARRYEEASPGHVVQIWGDEWTAQGGEVS